MNLLKIASSQPDCPFDCSNLDKYISSDELWSFINENVNRLVRKVPKSEEIERSLWEIKKELNFIFSQYSIVEINNSQEIK